MRIQRLASLNADATLAVVLKIAQCVLGHSIQELCELAIGFLTNPIAKCQHNSSSSKIYSPLINVDPIKMGTVLI